MNKQKREPKPEDTQKPESKEDPRQRLTNLAINLSITRSVPVPVLLDLAGVERVVSSVSQELRNYLLGLVMRASVEGWDAVIAGLQT